MHISVVSPSITAGQTGFQRTAGRFSRQPTMIKGRAAAQSQSTRLCAQSACQRKRLPHAKATGVRSYFHGCSLAHRCTFWHPGGKQSREKLHVVTPTVDASSLSSGANAMKVAEHLLPSPLITGWRIVWPYSGGEVGQKNHQDYVTIWTVAPELGWFWNLSLPLIASIFFSSFSLKS